MLLRLPLIRGGYEEAGVVVAGICSRRLGLACRACSMAGWCMFLGLAVLLLAFGGCRPADAEFPSATEIEREYPDLEQLWTPYVDVLERSRGDSTKPCALPLWKDGAPAFEHRRFLRRQKSRQRRRMHLLHPVGLCQLRLVSPMFKSRCPIFPQR